MKHEDLTHRIIGCAYQVYNQLGFGFLESVYKKAMVIELINNGLSVIEEKALQIYPIVAKVEDAADPRRPRVKL